VEAFRGMHGLPEPGLDKKTDTEARRGLRQMNEGVRNSGPEKHHTF
jgi:hypothetical protein